MKKKISYSEEGFALLTPWMLKWAEENVEKPDIKYDIGFDPVSHAICVKTTKERVWPEK